jgi:hypothetical protein
MTSLPAQTVPVFCVDEDLLVRASGDYITLCPTWQCLAKGTDGVFAAGSPWSLSSPTVNFAAQGVQGANVIALTGPRSQFPGGGDMLAIDSVSTDGTTLTLRRGHQAPGVGQPPAPAAGLTGVSFSIQTFYPQIEEASFTIKRAFNIDENLPMRTSSWVYDLRDVRILTVLTVLYDRYTSELRADRGDWMQKIRLIKSQRDEVYGRVEIRWGPLGTSAEPTTIFSTKLSR